jgi:uncharacterized membrane protein YeaQ/YmgE (transglycosylase-associated protein family)
MMNVLGWILFGFVVGLIARAIMPEKISMSLLGTTVLGILGAVLAGWVGQAVGWYAPNEGAGFISATVGAIVVLSVYYAIARRSMTRPFSSRLPGVRGKSDKDHHDRWAA